MAELQPINPFAGFLEGRQARLQENAAHQQNALLQLQMSEAQRQVQEREGLNRLYQGAINPDGSFDYPNLLQGAAQGGYGSAIPGILKQKSDQDASQRAADKARIEGALQRFNFVGQVLSPVRDEQGWQRATALIAQEYPDMQLPEHFDPAAMEAARLQAMPVKEQLEQEWKKKGYDLDQQKFTYQQQNDAANRGVTLRGQNMADARAREGTRKGQYDADRGLIVDPMTGVARPVTLADGGALPPKAAGGKPLPAATVEKLTGDAEKADNLTALSGSFKDRFAGNKIGGGIENFAGRHGYGDTEQAEWWQQYDRMKNAVRNELFGATLTPSEEQAFLSADIHPNMDPKIVKKNLAMQEKIIRSGLQRKAKVWEAQGYNAQAVVEATSPAGGGFKYLGAE